MNEPASRTRNQILDDIARRFHGLAPCLLIDWRDEAREPGDNDGVLYADYVLLMPLDKHDIRRDRSHPEDVVPALALDMGSTRCSGGRLDPCRGGTVDTPFRDGVHIRKDAGRLNLPAYAAAGDRVSRIAVIQPGGSLEEDDAPAVSLEEAVALRAAG